MMTDAAKRVLEDALRLSGEQRAEVAAELLASLGPPGPGSDRTDDEWIAEIERRARAAESGVKGIPWPEVRQRCEDGLADQ